MWFCSLWLVVYRRRLRWQQHPSGFLHCINCKKVLCCQHHNQKHRHPLVGYRGHSNPIRECCSCIRSSPVMIQLSMSREEVEREREKWPNLASHHTGAMYNVRSITIYNNERYFRLPQIETEPEGSEWEGIERQVSWNYTEYWFVVSIVSIGMTEFL